MKTRQARQGDLDAWVGLRHALWPKSKVDALVDEARALLAAPDQVCFLLIGPDAHIVGFVEAAVHSGPNGPYGHVEGWYVMPEFRGQGHGHGLVELVEQWCLHRAIFVLTSDTDAAYPLSPAAHARSGFRKIGELIIFMKELQESPERDKRKRNGACSARTIPSSEMSMGRHLSDEEVEQQHLQAFGSALGPVYHALDNEVTWLHAKWLEYRKLYAHSKERIDLLNGTAAFFFRVVQQVLWEDVLLHIARLTDPPKSGKFENLTLRRLPDAVPDQCLADQLRKLVQDAQDLAQFARQWRDKRLAHCDLSLAINVKAEPLPGVSRQHVEEALSCFRGILNRLHVSYLHGEVAYEHFLTNEDADALVHHLKVAARSEQRQRQRLEEGKPLPEDLEPPPEA